MKIDKLHIEKIKNCFNSMKSKEDFLELLNYCKIILYGEKISLFTIKQLNFHYSQLDNPKRYIKFEIKKKSGQLRTIHSPNATLKAIQRCLNLIFQILYVPHESAYGFIENKSIVGNARIHVGNNYVFNLDLKDFFPSIDQARIWGRLKYPPFNLNAESGRLELANVVASLCCHKMEVERNVNGNYIKTTKAVLPQGAPTSPILTNIICERLDWFLKIHADKNGVKYTRYADDITLSSMHNVYQDNSPFIVRVKEIIQKQNFEIKDSKTRLQKRGYRQEVTGLTVNDKVNINKRYISQLRLWLHWWEKGEHDKIQNNYLKDKGNVKNIKVDIQFVLMGKLEYLKMIKGIKNNQYVSLLRKYELSKNRNLHLETVMNLLLEDGLEVAMNYFVPINNQNE